MSLNDKGGDEFDNQLQDEDIFDANPPPGLELLGFAIEPDYGSGSYAQDGPLEVLEDFVRMNGELIGAGADIIPQTLKTFPLPSELPPGKQGVDWYQNTTDGKIYVWNPISKLFSVWVPPPKPKFKLPSFRASQLLTSSPTMSSSPVPSSSPTPPPMPTLPPDLPPMPVTTSPLEEAADVMSTPSVFSSPGDEAAREARKAAVLVMLSKFNRAKPSTKNKEYKKLRAAIAAIGSAAMYGESEIGAYADEGGSEIGEGWAPGEGFSEIGAFADEGGSEIGAYADEGGSEIGYGYYPTEGASELGAKADVMMPFEGFMLDDVHMGSAAMYGPTEIGGGWAAAEGASEIGARAVAKVVEKARDNRQPPPPLKAVDAEAPMDEDDWSLTDVILGAAAATGHPDPFPMTSQFMLRAGTGMPARFVRVDTEDSYKTFRADNSPELSELRARLEEHISDPNAHEHDDLTDDIEDLVLLGEEAEAAEAEKTVEMWMPRHFDGHVTAWREGDSVCASIRLPGFDGETRICTSVEPLEKCISEMSRHAVEAKVPAAAVVGVLPAMGCVLGAGTAMKEMAAAAPSILSRPEAKARGPFVVRLEPKVNPALAALAMLAMACRQGSKQACDEWANLSQLAPGPVKQAMSEALQLAKATG